MTNFNENPLKSKNKAIFWLCTYMTNVQNKTTSLNYHSDFKHSLRICHTNTTIEEAANFRAMLLTHMSKQPTT